MDTAKVYFDLEGNELTIHQMVRQEPQWAASRIQEGEKAIDEITTLRQQLAESQARVAELELRAIDYLKTAPGLADPEDRIKARIRLEDAINKCPNHEAFFLRVQAEAVEQAAKLMEEAGNSFDAKFAAKDYAQRLRQQADQLEKAGGAG